MAKLDVVTTEFRRWIQEAKLKPGSILPTQKQFARELGVSTGTVRQAMNFLQKEGLIVATRGRGTQLARPMHEVLAASGEIVRFGLLITPSAVAQPVIAPTLSSIQASCEGHGGRRLSVLPCLEFPKRENLQNWAADLDVIIILGAAKPDFVQLLQAAGKPTIFVGELFAGQCPSWAGQFSIDLDSVALLSLQFLASFGHRNILLARSEGSYYREKLATAFESAVTQLSLPNFSQHLIATHSDGIEIAAGLCAEFKDTTAVIVEEGQRAGRVLHSLIRAGIRVPQNVSLLAISGVDPSLLVSRDLSRVEGFGAAHGEKILSLGEEMFREDVRVRVCSAPQLIWGNTCAQVRGVSS